VMGNTKGMRGYWTTMGWEESWAMDDERADTCGLSKTMTDR
jgi:hypothetical protein